MRSIHASLAACSVLLASPLVAGYPLEVGSAATRDPLFHTLAVYRSDDLWQTVTWGHFGDPKSIRIEHHDPQTDETREFVYSAAFRIDLVAAQKSDVAAKKEFLYVAGTTDTGEQIIERWVHKPKKVQVPDTPLAYELKRSTIYSGTSLGVIERLQVEPFGAFLVLVHANPDRHVSQMSLAAGHAVTQLLDPVYETLLASGVVAIQRAEHQTEGLLWIVYLLVPRQQAEHAIILRDMDADGILDDWMAYTYANMSEEYPSRFTRPPWVDDFRTYR